MKEYKKNAFMCQLERRNTDVVQDIIPAGMADLTGCTMSYDVIAGKYLEIS